MRIPDSEPESKKPKIKSPAHPRQDTENPYMACSRDSAEGNHKTKPKAKKSDLNSVQIAKSPLMLWKALVSYHPHMPPTTSATEFRKNS